jgi:hypothetical protein
MVDCTCDTHDLMVDIKSTEDMDDEMESYNGPMNKTLVKEESKKKHIRNLKIQSKKLRFTKLYFQDDCQTLGRIIIPQKLT